VTLRDKLAAADTCDALRLVAQARPALFAKVAELRAAHLQGGAKLSDKTRDSYAADARRVAACGGDMMAAAGTAATFRKVRAACRWKAREDLRECLARADRIRKKGGTGELEALCLYDENLAEIERRLAALDAMTFDIQRTRRHDKTHMQRHKLGRLPRDWLGTIHRQTRGGKYAAAIAVGILIPVRPEELSNLIRVDLDEAGHLRFEVKGSKLRDHGSGVASKAVGIGQPLRWLTLSAVDPARQETFDWLRAQAAANGGRLTVGKGLSASGLCSAFRSMSAKLFSGSKSPPSFYALRHAASAELKAAGLDALEVAAGMGHASTLSQKAYGTRSQGSGCYVVKATASTPVRAPTQAGRPPSASRRVALLGRAIPPHRARVSLRR